MISPPSNEERENITCNYRGVRTKRCGKWGAVIGHPSKRKRILIGTFNEPEEAAKAYDEVALRIHSHKAILHFSPPPPPPTQVELLPAPMSGPPPQPPSLPMIKVEPLPATMAASPRLPWIKVESVPIQGSYDDETPDSILNGIYEFVADPIWSSS